MIKVRYSGQMGNNLFQYVRGRILVYENPDAGMLESEPIPGFPNTAKKAGVGCGNKDIIVKGIFQDYKIYQPYKRRIHWWLKFERFPPQSEDKLIMHIRLGDYLEPRYLWLSLPMDYYHKVIEIDKPKNICIVTNKPKHPLLQQFDAEIVSESRLHDFAFLASAHRLCLANSTFSWWAGWLSDAKRIYFPQRPPWYCADEQIFHKLFVHDEERYIQVPVSGPVTVLSDGNYYQISARGTGDS